MIIRARTVVPIEGDPIEDGAVAVAGNRIADVGRFADVRKGGSGEVVDLGEQALLPGLINTHCHLDYTMLRGRIQPPASFADWIRAINAEKAKLNEADYVEAIEAGFDEVVRFGTTTLANLTAFPNLAGAIKAPIRTWWFGELIDVRNPDKAARVADEAMEALKPVKRWGLAPHAPFTASPSLYARCEEIAGRENVLLTTHLAESREEMQMFRDGNGPLFEFLESIGRAMEDCGRETPFSFFKRTRDLDDRWILAHLNELDGGDFESIAGAAPFHVAHCPRSHRYFRHSAFPLARLRDLGVNICLGTDSLASNPDLSMFAEIRELLRTHASVSPREALTMATRNGAIALGQRNILGSVRRGACADLIAVPMAEDKNVFESIVSWAEPVPWTMANGIVLGQG